jgi:hypothetical protein
MSLVSAPFHLYEKEMWLIHIVEIPLEITNSGQRNYQSRNRLAVIKSIAGMSLSARISSGMPFP